MSWMVNGVLCRLDLSGVLRSLSRVSATFVAAPKGPFDIQLNSAYSVDYSQNHFDVRS